MAFDWMRRGLVASACTALTLLTACGSSTVDSVASPDRIVAFGDAVSDVGQKDGRAYTVNATDGTLLNWTAEFARQWGKTMTPASAGGLSYAQGNARIALTPDAAGNADTPTISAQIDRFLQSHPAFGSNDFVLINGGISDLIVGMVAVQAQRMTREDYVQQARAWGEQLGAQVRRLVQAGATHVVLAGAYDLGVTPWGKSTGEQALLLAATESFTTGLKVSINDLGQAVQYVDLQYYVNMYTQYPSGYSFDNAVDAVCTSVDAGQGIGTGTGQVNAALCTPATVRPNADYNRYVFADNVYLSPSAQRQFGAYARDTVRSRW